MQSPFTTTELDALLKACIEFADAHNEESFYAGNIANREGVGDIDPTKRMMEWVAETDKEVLENMGLGKDGVTYFRIGVRARQVMNTGGFKNYFKEKKDKGQKSSASRKGGLTAQGPNPSIISPEGLILTAKKAVPSFKWVIGAAALLALAGIVIKWKFNLAALFLVAGILLVAGVAFIVLQWISKLKADKASVMAAFMAWSLLIFLICALLLVLISATCDRPWPIQSVIRRMLDGTNHSTILPPPLKINDSPIVPSPSPAQPPAVEYVNEIKEFVLADLYLRADSGQFFGAPTPLSVTLPATYSLQHPDDPVSDLSFVSAALGGFGRGTEYDMHAMGLRMVSASWNSQDRKLEFRWTSTKQSHQNPAELVGQMVISVKCRRLR